MFSDLFSFEVLLEMLPIFMNAEELVEKQEAVSKFHQVKWLKGVQS